MVLTRVFAALADNVRVGYIIPDYTAYEVGQELLVVLVLLFKFLLFLVVFGCFSDDHD